MDARLAEDQARRYRATTLAGMTFHSQEWSVSGLRDGRELKMTSSTREEAQRDCRYLKGIGYRRTRITEL